MKKFISMFIIVFLAEVLFAQSTSDKLLGFWGIKWGTSIEETKNIVKQKGSYIITEELPDAIAYKGNFGGEDTSIFLYFFDNKFYKGVVSYPYEENRVFSKYRVIKEQVSSKYGKPQKETELFLKPYYDGDGYEEQAVRVNKCIYYSTWNFSDQNIIGLTISNKLHTLLFYKNTKMQEEADKKEKEKNMSDF
ncbi:MAG: hypothetical protein IKZ79_03405 [Spirochaetia bacterium]|nr:hypothetical protein [Spirochaetia bacterium]